MKYTLNQLIKQFEHFAAAHSMIHSFSYGELSTLSNEEQSEVIYPLMHVNISDGSIDDHYVYLNFNILLMDLVQKDNSNIADVQSDTLLILNDFRTWLNRTKQFNDYGVFVERAQLTPFVDRFTDEVTGHRLLLYLKIRNLGNICNIPFYTTVEPVPFNCSGNEPILEFSPDLELVQVCEDSTIQIEALNIMTGQTTGNTFVWTLPDSVTHYTGSTITVNNAGEEHSGRFDLTVTNASGCTTNGFILVSVLPKPQLSVIDIVNESSPGANDGRFIIEATGGEAPYLFTDGVNVNFDGNFDLMAAGNYTVEVTSANSCTAIIQVTIN